MGERYQAIKSGLERALGIKKMNKEVVANREPMTAKPAMTEKPAGVVELSEEEVKEAEQHAKAGYQENDEEQKAA